MAFRVGCVPLNWGQFKRLAPDEWPEERILREVAQAGFEGISSGARKGLTPEQTVEFFAGFGLKPAPGYYGGDFWKRELREEQVEKARDMAAYSLAMGVSELFVAPSGGDYVSRANGQNRRQLAGHVGPDDGLTDDEYQTLADTLSEIGHATLEEGVATCIHNHVGQVIETRAEVDRLFQLVNRNVVFLGPDTGHLAWAGADVVDFFDHYGSDIISVHLKDVHENVRAEGAAAGWEYNTFTSRGVFAELGEGSVDFSAIFEILRLHAFDGWVLSETDVTQKATALESSTISRDYLKTLGI